MGIMDQAAPADGSQSHQSEADAVGSAEDNPAYQAAMEVVMHALYKQGGAKDIAKAFGKGDPAQSLADISYQIIQVADERTNGEVPDELLASLAVDVLTEVAEVADAAGVKVDGDVTSSAMRIIILRFLKEQGMPDEQIQQAMQAMGQDPGSAAPQSPGAAPAQPAQPGPAGVVA